MGKCHDGWFESCSTFQNKENDVQVEVLLVCIINRVTTNGMQIAALEIIQTRCYKKHPLFLVVRARFHDRKTVLPWQNTLEK